MKKKNEAMNESGTYILKKALYQNACQKKEICIEQSYS